MSARIEIDIELRSDSTDSGHNLGSLVTHFMLKLCISTARFAPFISSRSILSLRRSFSSTRNILIGQIPKSGNIIMGKDKEKEKLSFQLKTPKGCRDCMYLQISHALTVY